MNIREKAQRVLEYYTDGGVIIADEGEVARKLIGALETLETIAAYANVVAWTDGYDLNARAVARKATDDAKGFLASIEEEEEDDG